MASEDEREIRELVATWMAASNAGDVETVLSLMTEDAVFLVAGQPLMRKADFAAVARAQAAGADAPKFDGKSEIREIRVADEWAYPGEVAERAWSRRRRAPTNAVATMAARPRPRWLGRSPRRRR